MRALFRRLFCPFKCLPMPLVLIGFRTFGGVYATRSLGVYTSLNMSCDTRFPTMWYVRTAKAQTSLRIRAVWSEPLLVAWIFYECLTTDWTSFGVSKLKKRLPRLVWVKMPHCWKSHVIWLISFASLIQQC